MEQNYTEIPKKNKKSLLLERFGTKLVSKIIRKDKSTSDIQSVLNIPYTPNKTDKLRQFDWHCPVEISNNLYQTKTPVLFYIHGGSWSAADKSMFSLLSKEFAEQGLIVININYSLLPESNFATIYQDLVNCLTFCLKKRDMLGIDPQKVFFAGDSAGAHLSSLICSRITAGDLKIDINILGVILFYGVYDLKRLGSLRFRSCNVLHDSFLQTKGANIKQFYKEFSTTTYLTSNFPPAFITAGKIDSLHLESERLIDKLTELNVPVTSLIFPKNRLDARHAFVNIELKARTQALTKAFQFIHNQLKKAETKKEPN